MSEKCGAPNDKLLPDMISTEVYYCDLDLGHLGPHKSLGHPIWWDENKPTHLDKDGHAVYDDDFFDDALTPKDQFGPPNLAERALKAMLPPDAKDCAIVLSVMADKEKGWLVTDLERAAVRRAVEILRGEP